MIYIPFLRYTIRKAVMLLYYSEFGENLKKLRTAHSLTQQELGAKVGLSKAVVSKYENGLGYPTFDVLIRIAAYFGVTTDYLLGVTADVWCDPQDALASVLALLKEQGVVSADACETVREKIVK